ncbi:hypothetical protein [Flavobacterium weaverense]|uniref:Uncharacterized protein n=1 Tax=Flavobacterium weaverense TaxID=271156 RepID=A0A3M0A0Q5_9FLAO|nr:hypothetical protein [Flavobacterium weaverense]RMA77954.1 hypothetical protein BC961_0314 [Flavobacterium weaverense]
MSAYKIIVDDYKRRYVLENGENMYSQIYEKIKISRTFEMYIEDCIRCNRPLLAADFKMIGAAAMSFMSGHKTAIMGQLIALDIWNNRCNTNFGFLDQNELVRVADSCRNSYGPSYS